MTCVWRMVWSRHIVREDAVAIKQRVKLAEGLTVMGKAGTF